ncbi:MAG: TIGR03643 family protein [Bacteroidota bacterium]
MVDEKLSTDNSLPTVIKNYVSDSSDIIEEDRDRIIQMAWEDRTPFEAIEFQFGLKEKDVIEFMRKNSLPSSFKMWRKRMKSRKTKHSFLREKSIDRFKCSRQRNSGNKIAKR